MHTSSLPEPLFSSLRSFGPFPPPSRREVEEEVSALRPLMVAEATVATRGRLEAQAARDMEAGVRAAVRERLEAQLEADVRAEVRARLARAAEAEVRADAGAMAGMRER